MDNRKELMELFRQLKLKGFAERYEEVVSKGNKSIDQILLELCTVEADRRYSARVKRRIKQAGFPKMKTIAMFDYNLTPRLPRQSVENLVTCEFMSRKENVILVGDSGGGKTHLVIALGIEACKKIKSDPETHRIPVVFLSAKGQDSEIKAGLEAGAVEYLLKPFSPDDLNRRLREILAGK